MSTYCGPSKRILTEMSTNIPDSQNHCPTASNADPKRDSCNWNQKEIRNILYGGESEEKSREPDDYERISIISQGTPNITSNQKQKQYYN